ncbi:MAG: hypothetical protein J7K20_02095 [Thermodesulfobacterium sp.]|nr:hypothetical protein [Thermodesulfobacterium sp.]
MSKEEDFIKLFTSLSNKEYEKMMEAIKKVAGEEIAKYAIAIEYASVLNNLFGVSTGLILVAFLVELFLKDKIIFKERGVSKNEPNS